MIKENKLNYKFLLFLILSILLSLKNVEAVSIYNSTSNTIFITNGTNYPWTVYSDVNNSVYNRSGNTSVVTANIYINRSAEFIILNEEFVLNSYYNNEFHIKGEGGSLQIDNATVRGVNSSLHAWIYIKGYSNILPPRLNITNSELAYLGNDTYPSHGIMISQVLNSYPQSFINISNNVIRNSAYGVKVENIQDSLAYNNTIYNIQNIGLSKLILVRNNTIYNISGSSTPAGIEAEYNSTIENNTIYNINSSVGVGIYLHEVANVTTRYNTINNANVGIVASYCGFPVCTTVPDGRVYNNTVLNTAIGISFQSDFARTVVENNTIINSSSAAIEVYSSNSSQSMNNNIQNSYRGISIGLTASSSSYTSINDVIRDGKCGVEISPVTNISNIINIEILNTTTKIRFSGNQSSTAEKTGIKFINPNATTATFSGSNMTFNLYEYLDVKVVDSNSVPIPNVVISLTNVNESEYSSININDIDKTSFTTGNDGHTPLPTGNESNSIAVLAFWKNSTSQQNMSYSISVYDSSRLYEDIRTTVFSNGTMQALEPVANATVSPNSSWYRSNPNTYQNTTVIQITRLRSNISLKFPGGSITVSNITKRWLNASSGDNPGFVVFNNTIPEFANKNVSFMVDGVQYDRSTANSTGFLSFNYTGSWSSHTFEWAEGVGNVSGYITGDGSLLAGSTVTLYYSNGTSYGLSNITLSNGSYNFTNIMNGTSVYIRASRSNYSSGNSSNFTVPTNGTIIVNLSLAGIGNITGYIISGSSALSGAEVKLYYGNSTEYGSNTTSAADGSYNFTNILNDTWLYVRASKSGYTAANSSNFTVPTGGTAWVNVSLAAESSSSSSSSGGGGGGGGGAGASGENYTNIEFTEKYDLFIYKDVTTSYTSRRLDNPIVFINITGNTNAGEINIAVEVLRNTSSLVKTSPEGIVYKNVNIWVGTSGFATPKNIKDAVITFRVNKSWITENSIDAVSITLMQYSNGWNALPTRKISENAAELSYEANTNSFSPFAITGKKLGVQEIGRVESTTSSTEPQGQHEKPLNSNETAASEPKNPSSLSIFLLISAFVAIVVNSILVFKIRKRGR